jgi:hypothetical protein
MIARAASLSHAQSPVASSIRIRAAMPLLLAAIAAPTTVAAQAPALT